MIRDSRLAQIKLCRSAWAIGSTTLQLYFIKRVEVEMRSWGPGCVGELGKLDCTVALLLGIPTPLSTTNGALQFHSMWISIWNHILSSRTKFDSSLSLIKAKNIVVSHSLLKQRFIIAWRPTLLRSVLHQVQMNECVSLVYLDPLMLWCLDGPVWTSLQADPGEWIFRKLSL